MKTLFTLIIISLALAVTSCSDSSLTGPEDNFNAKRDKIAVVTLDAQTSSVDASEYPQSTSVVVYFKKNKDEYSGTTGELENKSCFEFSNGSLVPPSYITWGEEVTITMQADKDPVSGELIYTFGPSGCHFLEPAQLWLDYSDLGTDKATLYYLDDDGNRIEHLPDNIDLYNKMMCIYIDHFSRYAVAYSD